MSALKVGDIFEIQTNRGLGYFQCVKLGSPTECETIRVFSGVHEARPNTDRVAEQTELYFVQFPLRQALRRKAVTWVGNRNVSERVVPPRQVRDEHVVRGNFVAWHIIDTETLMITSVETLTDEQRKLSPAGIWNDTLLAERIADGWRPEYWV